MMAYRDIETMVGMAEFVAELRRLADALEAGGEFAIELDGERITVPVNAIASVEYERDGGARELEFQLRWGDLDAEDDIEDRDEADEGEDAGDADQDARSA